MANQFRNYNPRQEWEERVGLSDFRVKNLPAKEPWSDEEMDALRQEVQNYKGVDRSVPATQSSDFNPPSGVVEAGARGAWHGLRGAVSPITAIPGLWDKEGYIPRMKRHYGEAKEDYLKLKDYVDDEVWRGVFGEDNYIPSPRETEERKRPPKVETPQDDKGGQKPKVTYDGITLKDIGNHYKRLLNKDPKEAQAFRDAIDAKMEEDPEFRNRIMAEREEKSRIQEQQQGSVGGVLRHADGTMRDYRTGDVVEEGDPRLQGGGGFIQYDPAVAERRGERAEEDRMARAERFKQAGFEDGVASGVYGGRTPQGTRMMQARQGLDTPQRRETLRNYQQQMQERAQQEAAMRMQQQEQSRENAQVDRKLAVEEAEEMRERQEAQFEQQYKARQMQLDIAKLNSENKAERRETLNDIVTNPTLVGTHLSRINKNKAERYNDAKRKYENLLYTREEGLFDANDPEEVEELNRNIEKFKGYMDNATNYLVNHYK